MKPPTVRLRAYPPPSLLADCATGVCILAGTQLHRRLAGAAQKACVAGRHPRRCITQPPCMPCPAAAPVDDTCRPAPARAPRFPASAAISWKEERAHAAQSAAGSRPAASGHLAAAAWKTPAAARLQASAGAGAGRIGN